VYQAPSGRQLAASESAALRFLDDVLPGFALLAMHGCTTSVTYDDNDRRAIKLVVPERSCGMAAFYSRG